MGKIYYTIKIKCNLTQLCGPPIEEPRIAYYSRQQNRVFILAKLLYIVTR